MDALWQFRAIAKVMKVGVRAEDFTPDGEPGGAEIELALHGFGAETTDTFLPITDPIPAE